MQPMLRATNLLNSSGIQLSHTHKLALGSGPSISAMLARSAGLEESLVAADINLVGRTFSLTTVFCVSAPFKSTNLRHLIRQILSGYCDRYLIGGY